MVFLRKLLVEITGPLKSDDLRELSKMLDIERNRKMDAERAARGGGKKKKAKAKPRMNANKAVRSFSVFWCLPPLAFVVVAVCRLRECVFAVHRRTTTG